MRGCKRSTRRKQVPMCGRGHDRRWAEQGGKRKRVDVWRWRRERTRAHVNESAPFPRIRHCAAFADVAVGIVLAVFRVYDVGDGVARERDAEPTLKNISREVGIRFRALCGPQKLPRPWREEKNIEHGCLFWERSSAGARVAAAGLCPGTCAQWLLAITIRDQLLVIPNGRAAKQPRRKRNKTSQQFFWGVNSGVFCAL